LFFFIQSPQATPGFRPNLMTEPPSVAMPSMWKYGLFSHNLFLMSLSTSTTDVPSKIVSTPTLISTTAPSVARFIPISSRYPIWPGMNTTVPNKESGNNNNDNTTSSYEIVIKLLAFLVTLLGLALIACPLYKMLLRLRAMQARRFQNPTFDMVSLDEI